MHMRVSQKIFGLYCVSIVSAVVMTTDVNKNFSFQTFFTFFKNSS